MGLPCTPVPDDKPSALRALVGAWVFAVLIVALACVLQIAGSSKASASGFHHDHSPARSAIVQNDAVAIAPVSWQGNEVVMRAMQHADFSDCTGHASHKTGSKAKDYCASMCCAAALVWNSDTWHVPGQPLNAPWTFSQQFVVLKHASGLDRPPDFRT